MIRKPKIKLESVRHLLEIDEYIRQYDLRGRNLESSASDVLDGSVFREEIEDLINRKLLTLIVEESTYYNNRMCGTSWTVHLTPRAMKAFWPARVGIQ